MTGVVNGKTRKAGERRHLHDGPDAPHDATGTVAAVAEGHEDQDDGHQREDEARHDRATLAAWLCAPRVLRM